MTGHDNGVITIVVPEADDIERERRRTAHPWEDFAETWAHYLHIVDTLEMAGNFGMQTVPAADRIGGLRARVEFAPYAIEDVDGVTRAWFPFVLAMNSLSRTIGTREMYLFVLRGAVIGKLAFIHELVQRAVSVTAGSGGWEGGQSPR